MDHAKFHKRNENKNGGVSRSWNTHSSSKFSSSRRESLSEIIKTSKCQVFTTRQPQLVTPSPDEKYFKQDPKFRSDSFCSKPVPNDHINPKDTAIKRSCNVIIRSFTQTPASAGHLSSATISGNCLPHLSYLDDINSRLKRLEQSGLMKKLKSKTPNSQKIDSHFNENNSFHSSPFSQVNHKKYESDDKIEFRNEPILAKPNTTSKNDVCSDEIHNDNNNDNDGHNSNKNNIGTKINNNSNASNSNNNNNNAYHHHHSYHLNQKQQPQKQQENNFEIIKKKFETGQLFCEKKNSLQNFFQPQISRLPLSKSDFIIHSTNQSNQDNKKNNPNNRSKIDKIKKAKSIPKLDMTQETKIKPIEVNGKLYYVLNLIGVGGFSKVYQVYDPSLQVTFALKVVDLSKVEESAKIGLKNEIKLLERLKNCKRVVKLIDHELIVSKNQVILVMEKGDSDLGSVLKQFIETDNSTYLDLTLLKHYWKEMLKAVSEIHKLGIVHSDLKPVNFISVGGKLKLIDFGIANAIQSDHTSVIKDHQVGTINYMAPEALCSRSDLDPSGGQSGKPYIKFNCKADVWSLGCILYNLTYGKPPFAHCPNLYSKLKAICDPKVEVNYPPHENHLLIDCLKKCLQKDPKKRVGVDELLHHPFLNEHSQSQSQSKLITQLNTLTPNRLNQLVKFAENLFRQ